MAYKINIVNGTGTSNVKNGEYSVTGSVTGYDNSSILPSTANIVEGTNTYNFTIAATGTLNLHVTENGLEGGTPIVGATFVRTDSTGTVYGDAITTDSTGTAVFNNVPFSSAGAPIIYYKQTASDEFHIFDDSVKNTTLTDSTKTIEIENALPPERTFNFTDANYLGLPISSGEIDLN